MNVTEVKEVTEDVETPEVPELDMPKFDVPKPDPRCKKCYGSGRLGYKYDPKNIELDEDGNRKKGEAITCPNYARIIQIKIKQYMDGLTDEQQYHLARKEGDPATLAEAKTIQDEHDAMIKDEDGIQKIVHMNGTDAETDGPLKGK